MQYTVRAWRWGGLLAPLARVPFSRLFSATIVGFMVGLLIPRAGELIRPYLVARDHALSTSAAFASIVLERLLDLITVLLLFGAYLYLLPTPAAQARGPVMDLVQWGGAMAALAALGALGLLLALHHKADAVMARVEGVLRWLPARIARPVVGALRNFAEGLGVLKASPAHLLRLLAESAVIWLFIALGVHWTNRAFGIDLPYHSAFLLLAFLTVGVAIPTPGMVGGFHGAYLIALAEVYGVDSGTAAAAGISCHALTNVPVLLIGLPLLGRMGLSMGSVARIGEAAAGEGRP
jgi:hypothetical protein